MCFVFYAFLSIKSQLYIPSAENNFPPVASAPAEGTQYAAANFNLSLFSLKLTEILYIWTVLLIFI